MWNYSKKVREYFLNPKNVGSIENPDARALVGSVACGDALELTLKVDADTEVISDAKFQTFGCASAIASSSMLTEVVIGKTLNEASKITNQQIADELGGLPEEKVHCSVMAMEALEKAIGHYRGEIDESQDPDEPESIVVCKCFNITDQKIARVIRENKLKTVEDVTHYTKAGGACGKCKPHIKEIMTKILREEL